MDDTADSACAVTGSGCGWFEREEITCDTAPPEETVEVETPGEGDRVEGGSCQCGVGAAAPVWWLALLAFAVLRRGWVALALCLALPAQAGVYAQGLRPLDGGPWVALREAELGEPGTVAAAISATWAQEPVVLVHADGTVEPLLQSALTTEIGASVNLGRLRLGAALPRHAFVIWRGERYDDEGGPFAFWLAMPMLPSEEERFDLAAWFGFEPRGGAEEKYLGRRNEAFTFHLAGEAPLYGTLAVAVNLGARLQPSVILPGTVWSHRLEYGVALRTLVAGPVYANAELFGSLPANDLHPNPASWPAEVLASVDVVLPASFSVGGGVGTGLTRGLGAPVLRIAAIVQYRPMRYPDSDDDGLVDPRDLCPWQPEDLDRFQDLDGCPDPDNDHDGIPDLSDACPNRPENLNGLRDGDGCPDALAVLEVRVVSSAPERAQSAVLTGADGTTRVFLGEWTRLEVEAGVHRLTASADGHHPTEVEVTAADGETVRVPILLEPRLTAALAVRVTDPAGAPLVAWLDDGERLEVPAEGLSRTVSAGALLLRVGADGFRTATLELELAPDEEHARVVVLEPAAVRVEGARIATDEPIAFALDADELDPAAVPTLEQIAALLRARPDIALLRVEGHADELGTSRYNLDLSRRRAEAVRAWLVGAGIEPARLEALGTGEARSNADDGSRRVEFLVLVWDDERPVDLPPPTPR